MSFRNPKKSPHEERAWLEWIDAHRETLRSIGLPPEVYLGQPQWVEFLESGDVSPHRFPGKAAGYSFLELTADQKRQLLTFLEAHDEFTPPWAGLPGFLRVQLEGVDRRDE